MKYLYERFEEELTASVSEETGNVCIGTLELEPLSILLGDEIAYKDSFVQWNADRERSLIDDTVAMLEDDRSSNDAFNALCLAFRTQRVLPFLGAGISKPSGYPLWTEFLYHLCDQAECSKDTIKKYIENAQYEEAAQYLYDNLPVQAFDLEIEMTFGPKPRFDGAVLSFPRFFRGSVITTNFDRVIQDVYRDAEFPFEDTLVGQQAEELPKRLVADERVLLYLHGKAATARNRVLTKREYDRAYKSNESVLDAISSITQNPLLFIGCSLSIDRTIQAMRQIHNERRRQDFCRHFAFLPHYENVNVKHVKRELAQANIVPIWYNGDHDQCIEGLLLTIEERLKTIK